MYTKVYINPVPVRKRTQNISVDQYVNSIITGIKISQFSSSDAGWTVTRQLSVN